MGIGIFKRIYRKTLYSLTLIQCFTTHEINAATRKTFIFILSFRLTQNFDYYDERLLFLNTPFPNLHDRSELAVFMTCRNRKTDRQIVHRNMFFIRNKYALIWLYPDGYNIMLPYCM